MGKLLCESSVAETLQASSPILPTWPQDPLTPPKTADRPSWDSVTGLEPQQRRYLQKLSSNGVFWKTPDGSSPSASAIFRLSHGGDVEADGNCLFTAAERAMGSKVGARELRKRTVVRFLADLGSVGVERERIDATIRHLYSPDLKAGWGIHVVQEVKLLARKEDREALDRAIEELVGLELQR